MASSTMRPSPRVPDKISEQVSRTSLCSFMTDSGAQKAALRASGLPKMASSQENGGNSWPTVLAKHLMKTLEV